MENDQLHKQLNDTIAELKAKMESLKLENEKKHQLYVELSVSICLHVCEVEITLLECSGLVKLWLIYIHLVIDVRS